MDLPTISIISLVYNPPLDMFKMSLESIKSQRYLKDHIEHLVMDGGSTNGSPEMAKKYGCTVYSMPELLYNGEGRKGIGISRAKNDIVAFIEADNILVGKDWFMRMVEPFIKDRRIVGTFSMYNSYKQSMPALTRYCALIGVNDPAIFYLGKSEKLTRYQKEYDKGTILSRTRSFTTVRFTRDTLPTIGDNGHMVLRRLIQSVNSKPKHFLHTDAFAKLLAKKHDTYGVVRNSIIHVTGSNIWGLYKRRIFYKNRFYDYNKAHRSYYVFNPHSKRDRWLLIRFIIYSLTLVEPIALSIRGFISVHDIAWFMHPIVCVVAVLSYGLSELRLFWLTYIMRVSNKSGS